MADEILTGTNDNTGSTDGGTPQDTNTQDQQQDTILGGSTDTSSNQEPLLCMISRKHLRVVK